MVWFTVLFMLLLLILLGHTRRDARIQRVEVVVFRNSKFRVNVHKTD